MSTIKIDYALPLSRLLIESTVTETKDSVLGTTKTVPQTKVSLETGAGERDLTLKLRSGWLVNSSVDLEMSEEGRLKSSSVEQTGELGKVVVGVVGAATTLAAAALTGGSGFVASAALIRGLQPAAAEPPFEEKPEEKSPAVLEAEAFAAHDADVAAQRNRYRELVTKAVLALEAAAGEAIDDPADAEKAKRVERLEHQLAALQARLDVLNGLFQAWRATTITSRTEKHTRTLSLDELERARVKVSDGRVCFGEGSAAEIAEFAWKTLGVAVTVAPPPDNTTWTASGGESARVIVREPRRALVNVYERGPGDKAVLRQSEEQLVMDSYCSLREVPLRKSLWSKRKVELGFSDLGALTSFKHEADASAAAVAETAGKLPATVTESLEQETKTRDALAKLRSGALDEELAKVKAEAELKQHEIALAGLNATASEAEKLERLKQQLEILEKEEKIGEAAKKLGGG